MAAYSKLNRMVRVSSHLEVELLCEDGSRAVLRGLYLGKYHIVFKCWPADRTEEELGQVHSEVQAALGGWVPLGRNVTAASVHLMPDRGMMVAYIDGGDDMEKIFNEKRGDNGTMRVLLRHYLASVLLALRDMHRRGVLHRDVKLANVLCNRHNGIIRLADPGTAIPIGNPTGLPFSGDAPHLARAHNPTAPGDLLNLPALDVQQLCLTVLIACIGERNMPEDISCYNPTLSGMDLLANLARTDLGALADGHIKPIDAELARLIKRIVTRRSLKNVPSAEELLQDPVLAADARRVRVTMARDLCEFQVGHHAAFCAGLEMQPLLAAAMLSNSSSSSSSSSASASPLSMADLIAQLAASHAAAEACEVTRPQLAAAAQQQLDTVEAALSETAALAGFSSCEFNRQHLLAALEEVQERMRTQAAAGSAISNGNASSCSSSSSSSLSSSSGKAFTPIARMGQQQQQEVEKERQQEQQGAICSAPSTPPAAVMAGRFCCADLETQLFAAADAAAAAAAAAAPATVVVASASTPVCPAGWAADEKAPAADVKPWMQPAAPTAAPPAAAAGSNSPRPLTPAPAVTAPYCLRLGTWHAADLQAAWGL